ncbi:MAG: methyltransferase family protein [Promethearchaeota archaeon]
MSFKEKIENRTISVFTRISSLLIPLYQYVPATAIWFGIMSVPILSYITYFLQNPRILKYDIKFCLEAPGFYFSILGFILFIYSLGYQLTHRKQLIQTGPYKYVRHPQYLAFIIMTFGMTSISFQTNPIINFELGFMGEYNILFSIWIAEVIAYIILGKIEDIALKAKYGDEFIKYANNVSFLFPSVKLKRNSTENE